MRYERIERAGVALHRALQGDQVDDRLSDLPEGTGSSTLYRNFLYWYLRAGPGNALELGSAWGTTAAYMAAAVGDDHVVITLDVSASEKIKVILAAFPNVVHVQSHSVCLNERARKIIDMRRPFRVVFCDTSHEKSLVEEEYGKYSHMVTADGIVAVDDIQHNAGMEAFWRDVRESKIELNCLNITTNESLRGKPTGFGVILP